MSCSGVACPADLIDRFKDDSCAGLSGQVCRVVGGVIVDNNELGCETGFLVGTDRYRDGLQRSFDQTGFVECRDDDGEVHTMVMMP